VEVESGTGVNKLRRKRREKAREKAKMVRMTSEKVA
jgi:hypothetical protein